MCEISRKNSERLLRKWQKTVGDTFFAAHCILIIPYDVPVSCSTNCCCCRCCCCCYHNNHCNNYDEDDRQFLYPPEVSHINSLSHYISLRRLSADHYISDATASNASSGWPTWRPVTSLHCQRTFSRRRWADLVRQTSCFFSWSSSTPGSFAWRRKHAYVVISNKTTVSDERASSAVLIQSTATETEIAKYRNWKINFS